MCSCVRVLVQRSEDNWQESVSGFYHVGSRDETQATRFSSNDLYLSSAVTSS